MAGQASSKRQAGVEPNQATELLAEYHAARRTFRDLAELADQSIDGQQARTVAEQAMWSGYAMLLMEQGDPTGAAKASAAAVALGKLAVSLSKSTLADRVAKLEVAVKEAKTAGANVRGAARSRKG
jgi:hypothetical protein